MNENKSVFKKMSKKEIIAYLMEYKICNSIHIQFVKKYPDGSIYYPKMNEQIINRHAELRSKFDFFLRINWDKEIVELHFSEKIKRTYKHSIIHIKFNQFRSFERGLYKMNSEFSDFLYNKLPMAETPKSYLFEEFHNYQFVTNNKRLPRIYIKEWQKEPNQYFKMDEMNRAINLRINISVQEELNRYSTIYEMIHIINGSNSIEISIPFKDWSYFYAKITNDIPLYELSSNQVIKPYF